MRFLIKKQNTTQGDQRQLGDPQTTYEVPNQTITWAAVIYLLLTIGGNTASSLITNGPANKRNAELAAMQKEGSKQSLMLVEQNLKIQLLQKVLMLDSNADRKASLLLLIKANVLNDDAKQSLYNFLKETEYISKWPSSNNSGVNNELVTLFIKAATALPSSTTQTQTDPSRSTMSVSATDTSKVGKQRDGTH